MAFPGTAKGDNQAVAREPPHHETPEISSNLTSPALTLAMTVIGAFVGAFANSRFSYRHQSFAEQDTRRRSVADNTLRPLLELRRLLRNAEKLHSTKEWATTTEAADEALDDARYFLPPSLSHLKRIVRASIGEAIGGVVSADIELRMLNHELEPYDQQWSMNAEEYLDAVIDTIREWRDANRGESSQVIMLNSDNWLKITGRYQPYE